MCNIIRCSFRSLGMLPLLAVMLLGLTIASPANTIEKGVWTGNDFIITFSDSASFHVDLEETDSTHLVVRIGGGTSLSAPLANALAQPGPDSRTATLTGTQDSVRLTVTGAAPFGYSTLWQPFSKRLVIHTFAWSGLSYSEDQYHKGLLALEQGFDKQAEELLKVAYQTGESRAGSALASYFAQRGDDSSAMRYLSAPITPENYATLAAIQRRAGDVAAAEQNEAKARALPGEGDSTTGQTVPGTPPVVKPTGAAQSPAPASSPDALWVKFRASLRDWRVIAAILFIVLAIVLGIFALVMRRSARRSRDRAEARLAERRSAEPRVTRITPPGPVDREPAWEQKQTPPVVAAPPAPVAEPTVRVVPPAPVAEPTVTAPAPEEPADSGEPVAVTNTEVDIPVAVPFQRPETETSSPSRGSAFVRQYPVPDEPVIRESVPEPRPEPEPHPVPQPASDPLPEPVQQAPRRISSQAEALRRRLEGIRGDEPASVSGSSPSSPAPSEPSEPIIDAARRLNVSRDHVELRKKLGGLLSKDKPGA